MEDSPNMNIDWGAKRKDRPILIIENNPAFSCQSQTKFVKKGNDPVAWDSEEPTENERKVKNLSRTMAGITLSSVTRHGKYIGCSLATPFRIRHGRATGPGRCVPFQG
ncbi:MAG: hypothetical protein HQM00_09190 [Magnetococcales bacterium]|nr:hypothetical protein [Magnetococcales bacterium]